ncbi:MAG: hypothetical protein ACRDUV_13990, partial [Pseudonocardiaceae bacterium]
MRMLAAWDDSFGVRGCELLVTVHDESCYCVMGAERGGEYGVRRGLTRLPGDLVGEQAGGEEPG